MPSSQYTAVFEYTWPTLVRSGVHPGAQNLATMKRLVKVKVPSPKWAQDIQDSSQGNARLVKIMGKAAWYGPLEAGEKAIVDNLYLSIAGSSEGYNDKHEQPRRARVRFDSGEVVNFLIGDEYPEDLHVGQAHYGKKIMSANLDGERRGIPNDTAP